jgi:hypothetical protein
MNYTLLTATGRILVFRIKECAEIYRSAYGGVIMTDKIVKNILDGKTNPTVRRTCNA